MALPPDQPDYSVPTLGPISKESRLSWHSQLSNHGTTPAWRRVTGDYREGKFFPRGCRGHISTIDVYSRADPLVNDTIRVYISPQPGLGPTYTVDITVTAGTGDGWRYALFNIMWNYDSLFIFVVSLDGLASWGYDVGAPYDYYRWSPVTILWSTVNIRLWIRVNFTGETAGDVPVSGTLNTIPLPNFASARQEQVLNVPSLSALYDTLQPGAGHLLIAIFSANTDEIRNTLRPRVVCDGNQVLPFDGNMALWESRWITPTSPGITVGVWDTVGQLYSIIVTVRYPFRCSLQIGFYNADAAVARVGQVAYSYERLV